MITDICVPCSGGSVHGSPDTPGDDNPAFMARSKLTLHVIPTKVGIQGGLHGLGPLLWIPACAGMTGEFGDGMPCANVVIIREGG